jgi:two-component system, OmpR family, alkaline phosphatase synthesis response regulator PhoP
VSRILIVEDDPDLARGLRSNLEIEGHEAHVMRDGRAALELLRRSPPDLVVLDLMLPGLDGLRVLSELRRSDSATPVLILTAKEAEGDKVRALRLGADDYVTKPFGLLELMARVEALLRRGGRQLPPSLSFGEIEIRTGSRTVRRAGQEVGLRPREYELLLALVRRRGEVASRLELLREVWGYAGAAETRTVDTHVFELRRKLEADPSSPRHILTVWRVGYRWQG